MTWVGFWIHHRHERKHRTELNCMQQQIIAEVKNSLRK